MSIPTTGGPVFKTINFYAQMLRPGETHAAAARNRQPAAGAVRGQGPFDHRRQALRLGAVRHSGRAGRLLGRACQRLGQASRRSSSAPPTRRPSARCCSTSAGAAMPPAICLRLALRSLAFRCRNTRLIAPCRLPGRRPGLGRRHDALYRPHAPAERHDASSTFPTRAIPARSGDDRGAAGLAFAQGAGVRTAS